MAKINVTYHTNLSMIYSHPSYLVIAARFGNYQICKYILENSEDKNPCAGKGDTILHIAAYFNYKDLFEYVFNQAEDKNPGKSFEKTPLHIAAELGHFEICKVIMESQQVTNKNAYDTNRFFSSANQKLL